MDVHQPRYDLDRIFRLIISAGSVVLTLWLLAYLSDVLVPFALAILMAYLLNPIVNAFERKTGGRGTAVLLTLAIFFVFVGVTIPLACWFIAHEIGEVFTIFSDKEIKMKIVDNVRPYLEQLKLEEVQTQLLSFVQADAEQVKQWAIEGLKLILPKFWELTTDVLGVLGGVINALLALSGVIVVLLYLVFLLVDFRSVQRHWKEHLPPQYREMIVEFLEEFSLAMRRYFRGQFLVAASCGILFAIGFKLVGIRMAVFLGLSIGLLNMVPYLQSVGLIPAILLACLKAFEEDQNLFIPVLGVIVVFGLVQVVQDMFLVPRIMGQSTGLRPWVIMLSIFVWGKLLGFLGLVLAIPLSCLGLAYYRRFILKVHVNQSQNG